MFATNAELILQQAWQDVTTGEVTWIDVPIVDAEDTMTGGSGEG